MVLTYMSIADDIRARIKVLHGDGALSYLSPTIGSAPTARQIFVSEDVREAVNSPWPAYRTGQRHAMFRATLDNFTHGKTITIADDPFDKPVYSDIARTSPVKLEIWDIRSLEPDQGIRCFGAFGGLDLFIALTWDYRENIDDFTAAVKECRTEWDRLFPGIRPFKGMIFDEYLRKFVAV